MRKPYAWLRFDGKAEEVTPSRGRLVAHSYQEDTNPATEAWRRHTLTEAG
jgi:hypothetical protein